MSIRREGWVTRSFRKVVRRKQQVKSKSNKSASSRDGEHNKISVLNRGSFKKTLIGFGRSITASSSIMPLPYEHPHHPDSYPSVYYDEDEDAIYDFRKYCDAQAQEWNKVQQQRTYQVGYCR